jgi:hypothetical protein
MHIALRTAPQQAIVATTRLAGGSVCAENQVGITAVTLILCKIRRIANPIILRHYG